MHGLLFRHQDALADDDFGNTPPSSVSTLPRSKPIARTPRRFGGFVATWTAGWPRVRSGARPLCSSTEWSTRRLRRGFPTEGPGRLSRGTGIDDFAMLAPDVATRGRGRSKKERRIDGQLHPPRPDRGDRAARVGRRLRGVPEERRPLAPSADLPRVREGGLLRQLARTAMRRGTLARPPTR